jgi:hypothetical protein
MEGINRAPSHWLCAMAEKEEYKRNSSMVHGERTCRKCSKNLSAVQNTQNSHKHFFCRCTNRRWRETSLHPTMPRGKAHLLLAHVHAALLQLGLHPMQVLHLLRGRPADHPPHGLVMGRGWGGRTNKKCSTQCGIDGSNGRQYLLLGSPGEGCWSNGEKFPVPSPARLCHSIGANGQCIFFANFK